MQVKGGAMDRGRGRVWGSAAGVEPYALDPDEGPWQSGAVPSLGSHA